MVHSLGAMSHRCTHCNALRFEHEKKRTTLCYGGGKMYGLSNAFPTPAPQPLRDLLTSVPNEHQPLPPATKDFKQNIRAYNSALQMASTGLHIHSREQGINMIAIKGAVHHLLGPLQPTEHDVPQFAQLYITCWGLCNSPNMMCHNSPSCTSLIPWMHKSQHALQLWVLRALLCISQLWRGYSRCFMITTHLCNVSNKSWTCPHTTYLNGKLSLGSTATLTSDATMLLPPLKWLGCCQVRFFSNVYCYAVCLLPSYI